MAAAAVELVAPQSVADVAREDLAAAQAAAACSRQTARVVAAIEVARVAA